MIEGKSFVCDKCGGRFPLAVKHVRHVEGWTASRRAGGANAILRATYDGRVVCAPCFMEDERGEQGALF